MALLSARTLVAVSVSAVTIAIANNGPGERRGSARANARRRPPGGSSLGRRHTPPSMAPACRQTPPPRNPAAPPGLAAFGRRVIGALSLGVLVASPEVVL